MTGRVAIPDDLRALFDAACTDTLTEQQVEQLETWLRNDPAFARAYLDYFNLQCDLAFLSRFQKAAQATLASVAAEVLSTSEEHLHVPEDDTHRAPTSTGAWRRFVSLLLGTTPLSLVVAAVVVSALVGVMAITAVPLWQAANRGKAPFDVPTFVAQVTRSIDPNWADTDAGKGPGAHLMAGQKLDLQDGLVELTFRNSARVILQGPAALVLSSQSECSLENGRATAYAPKAAKGFTVQTPAAKIVDLGTQFGVSVDEETQSVQLHVFAGLVQLQTKPKDGTAPAVRQLRTGEAVSVKTGQPPEKLAHDEKAFVRELPPSSARMPEPVHQWTFNDGSARDVIGAAHGTLESGAHVADGRLHLDGTGTGVMRSVPLSRDIHSKTLVSWVSLGRLDQRGGSVLTLETTDGITFDGIVFGERTPRQWLAGSNGFQRSPVDNSGKAETQTAPATVMLAVVYRADGQITIYRNGMVYAGYRTGPPPVFSGGSCRAIFGRRHTGGHDWQMAAAIDEARIYAVPMTPGQIRQLYEEGPDRTTKDHD